MEQYAEERLFDRDGVNGARFSLANNFKGWNGSAMTGDEDRREAVRRFLKMVRPGEKELEELFRGEERMKEFEFVPFSEKQRRLLNWWRPGLKTAENDFVIADGAMRSGKTIGCIAGFLLWSRKAFPGRPLSWREKPWAPCERM